MSSSLNKKHRKIWHDHYGQIPFDENGISYEIHHINGDHNDNRIENLKCVTIAEHFDIHFSQGDYFACKAILKRILYNKQIFEDKVEEMIYKKENHPMYGKNHTRESKEKISKNHHDVSNENNPMYGKTHTIETKKKISISKKGQGKGIPKSAEQKEKMSKAVKLLTCPYCQKAARGNSMKRWHFDNCKEKKL